MRRAPGFPGVCAAAAVLLAVSGAAGAQEPAGQARGGLVVWDTVVSSREPIAAAALRGAAGWRRIAPGVPVGFEGDAVVACGRVTAVARRGAGGLEIYAVGPAGPVLRARLLPAGEAGSIEKLALVENTRGAAGLEVGWRSAAVRFRLKRGDISVEAAASGKATLRIECPGRFVCLPDFFADDLVVDARKIRLDRVDLPSENLVMHFPGRGDALAVAVFEDRQQDVRVTLSGEGEGREVTGTEIDFGGGKRIWLALLEAPGIWHALDLAGDEDAKKAIPLEWKMPFVAGWRADFTRRDGLTDSWEMLRPEENGHGYVKPSWLGGDVAARTVSGTVDARATYVGGPVSDRLGPERKRWTTVLGWFQYPCWSDREGRGYIQPMRHKRLSFKGPVVIYPVSRVSRTPIDAYTVVDAVRNTLGVGPCEYILDLEGQKAAHVGRATCTVSDLLVEIFKKGQQKARRKEMEGYLQDGLDFVTHIRDRVAAYVEFGRRMRAYLAAQREARPEIRDFLEEMEALAGEIDARIEPRLRAIQEKPVIREIAEKTASATGEIPTPKYVAELNRRFVENLIDYTGADWAKRLEGEYTLPLRHIGGNQDEMVGECRWVVRALRQKAALRAAEDPRAAQVAAEIRAQTQRILRGGAAYEGARH